MAETSDGDGPSKQPPGLYLVATPIGNLGDIGSRALDLLRTAEVVACEDTRVTGNLLHRFGIDRRLVSYHEHNAARMRPSLIAALAEGARVALVSDAGSPLVSDPGYKLVRAAIDAGIPVRPVPGPSSVIAALTVSGLPCDRFYFAGFLPPKGAARRQALERLAASRATAIVMESPRRLATTLSALAEAAGDRRAAVARELTKLHEEVRRDRLSGLAAHYAAAGPPRGETVIVVGPPEDGDEDGGSAADEVDRSLRVAMAAMKPSEAAAAVAAATGLPRRRLYARALVLRSGDGEPEG